MLAGLVLSVSGCGSKQTGSGDGLFASQHEIVDSPDWVKELDQAKDESVKQLFVVAGMAKESVIGTLEGLTGEPKISW